MSLTNIRNDPCRLRKEMQIFTEEGRYMLNVPGPGANTPFQEDPFIRLQKWGTNIRTNTINVESDLMGLSRNLTKDCQNYKHFIPYSRQYKYYNNKPITDQSRAIMPAWTARMHETDRWDYLPLDPQAYLDIPFYNNLSTRIIEKDNYCP